MSRIISYDFKARKDFMQSISNNLEDSLTQALPFDVWAKKFLTEIYTENKKNRVVQPRWGEPIRISYSGVEMLEILKNNSKALQQLEAETDIYELEDAKTEFFKKILTPKQVINLSEAPTIDIEGDPVPVWFNTTLKSIILRPGFFNLDTANPGRISFDDNTVHGLMGGTTGSGKSVSLHAMIMSALLEYPPWELELYLADFKIVELSRYANMIPTPHVKLVGATESTEYILSIMQELDKELKARLTVFEAVGVNSIESFRTKYNLVLPRILLAIDEFVQMYINIAESEQKGNTNAQQMKMDINAIQGSVSKLGRSQGLHMFLSSQNLDGKLDEQVESQMHTGMALKCTSSVSNLLIGNDLGPTLRGKGKGYVSSDRSVKDISVCNICWIPYLQHDKKMSGSNLTQLQYYLAKLYKLSQSLGWDSAPRYYNSRVMQPEENLHKAVKDSFETFNSSENLTDYEFELKRRELLCNIPLGRELRCDSGPFAEITIKRRKNNNLIIDATEIVNKVYIINLIASGLQPYGMTHYVVNADKQLFSRTDLTSICGENLVELSGSQLPHEVLKICKTRKDMISFYELLPKNNGISYWNPKTIFSRVCEITPVPTGMYRQVGEILNYAEQINYNFPADKTTAENCKDLGIAISDDMATFSDILVSTYNTIYKTLAHLSKDFTISFTASDFKPLVLWWLGIDSIDDAVEFMKQNELAGLIEESPAYNVLHILVADRWDRINKLSLKCDYVLENSGKEFFNSIDLPVCINTNENTFQSHIRHRRNNQIIQYYNIWR